MLEIFYGKFEKLHTVSYYPDWFAENVSLNENEENISRIQITEGKFSRNLVEKLFQGIFPGNFRIRII